MIQYLILSICLYVTCNGIEKKPKGSHGLSAHASTKDYWNGLSAHDLFDQFGSDWAGASTLEDGSHNPNEIKGWGSASATAWTQPAKPAEGGGTTQQQQPGGAPQQQVPMQQPGGYSGGYTQGGYQQQGGYGYSAGTYQQAGGYGYSAGTYQQQPSAGYGYSAGTYQGGYQQPSYGTSYGNGYDTSGGYSSAGFGYSTGYDQSQTGYSSTGFGAAPSGGQMPGGQQPMGAPGAAAGGSGMMGAPGGAAGGGMMGAPGAAGGGMMPGAKAGGMPMGAQSGKCPLPHRHRKPWALLTTEQKDMFIDGFQQVRKNGKLDVIAQTHGQHDIQNYVHYTSLFSFYHSYMVWELETAIRDLGGKFACFTMPYYDWTLDAGLEDDPTILNSGVGGDGDRENGLCVMDDDTGFSWQTCEDYSAWREVGTSQEDGEGNDDDDDDEDNTWDGTYSTYDDGDASTPDGEGNDDNDGAISYTNYDNDIFEAHSYIDYGSAYDMFDPDKMHDDMDPDNANPDDHDLSINDDDLADDIDLEAESVEEQCFWTQANCRSNENSPFCCLKRKKSTTVLLPTAAEIGDAMYRSKNIKEWQGYLNEYYNKVQALFGADYYAHMANGYATEDPIFWLTHSFLTHLFSLWQDCWNYNNIPKDKLDMHYNSYHPYCGTFDATPDNCHAFNLALDAPMNFYELQKSDWSMSSHKIITVRKMWTPDFWNVVYELGPFYTTSGVNNWCDNTRDSEWFIETMDYDVDAVKTEINTYSKNLREQMINDGVEQSGIFKTVGALTCMYSRKYSANSCWDPELEEMDKEVCDNEDISVNSVKNDTLDEFLEYEGVKDNQCLKKIRRESFPYAEHALQVKKQLCKGDWDYKCPEYNELLYGQYASTLDSPISKQFKKHTSFFAKSGWIWMIVINGILVIIVAIGCGIWHCSRSKTSKLSLDDDENGDIENEDENGDNTYGTIQTSEVEEYQPLLV